MDWTTENIKWFFQQSPPRQLDDTLLKETHNVIFPKVLRVVFFALPALMLIVVGLVLTLLLWVIVVIPFLGAITAILPLGILRCKSKSLERLLTDGVLSSAVIEKVRPGPKGSLVVELRFRIGDMEYTSKTRASGRNQVIERLMSLREAGQQVLVLADLQKPGNIFSLGLLTMR
jgi:hypothetical protein